MVAHPDSIEDLDLGPTNILMGLDDRQAAAVRLGTGTALALLSGDLVLAGIMDDTELVMCRSTLSV
jgi:hypothetical protein